MSIFPEKWCILRTSDNYKEVNALVIKKLNLKTIAESPEGRSEYLYLNNTPLGWSVSPRIPQYCKEIIIEQLREIMKETRKIVGYKAPFHINNIILKDTIYIKDAGAYCPQNMQKEGSCWYLPAQIVETWEPIYEQGDIVLTIGSPLKEVKITKEDVFCADKRWNISLLKDLINKDMTNQPRLNGFEVTFPSVKIGCSTFTLEEIQKVINTYISF